MAVKVIVAAAKSSELDNILLQNRANGLKKKQEAIQNPIQSDVLKDQPLQVPNMAKPHDPRNASMTHPPPPAQQSKSLSRNTHEAQKNQGPPHTENVRLRGNEYPITEQRRRRSFGPQEDQTQPTPIVTHTSQEHPVPCSEVSVSATSRCIRIEGSSRGGSYQIQKLHHYHRKTHHHHHVHHPSSSNHSQHSSHIPSKNEQEEEYEEQKSPRRLDNSQMNKGEYLPNLHRKSTQNYYYNSNVHHNPYIQSSQKLENLSPPPNYEPKLVYINQFENAPPDWYGELLDGKSRKFLAPPGTTILYVMTQLKKMGLERRRSLEGGDSGHGGAVRRTRQTQARQPNTENDDQDTLRAHLPQEKIISPGQSFFTSINLSPTFFDVLECATDDSLRQSLPSPEEYRHILCQTIKFGQKNHWQTPTKSQCCTTCNTSFGIWTRMHHCRLCGHIFCEACSAKRVLGVRVCEGCASCLHK